ncbi:hypothetical protein FW778_03320 [Ginsengibacter hankyongi]|uniref:Cytochrome c domain-containing protein n=1 Tax=Ginsengibacter hankyongi TaxID=2607284 RepID=A0A5J5IMH3_9BACT|nr:hypothetical protein [Ginsengibacter hankyongi]KAA9041084.1 hypothetical protein FW778_03320 [Ginsengibacter hankyongi]
MKRLLIYAGLLFFTSFVLSSCYKDVILPAVANTKPPQYVSFSTDLQPIFTANCALSGCHVKGSQAPYLSADVSYQQLLGGFVNTIKPEQSELYQQINGNMQVHIPNADDRRKIYDWIRNGAPNN